MKKLIVSLAFLLFLLPLSVNAVVLESDEESDTAATKDTVSTGEAVTTEWASQSVAAGDAEVGSHMRAYDTFIWNQTGRKADAHGADGYGVAKELMNGGAPIKMEHTDIEYNANGCDMSAEAGMDKPVNKNPMITDLEKFAAISDVHARERAGNPLLGYPV